METKGRTITYRGGRTIPGLATRSSIARAANPELAARVDGRIQRHEPIMFMPFDVRESRHWPRDAPATYRLVLYGALVDGTKAQVSIDGIDVHFDVEVPEGTDAKEFAGALWGLLEEAHLDAQPNAVKTLDARTMHKYTKDPTQWVRLSFDDLWGRHAAIKHIQSLGHKTASDDANNYHRVVARHHNISLSDWVRLDDYEFYRGAAHPDGANSYEGKRSPLCDKVFVVNADKVTTMVDPLGTLDEQKQQQSVVDSDPALLKSRGVVVAWDIETYSGRRTGVPKAHNPDDEVFMIGCTVHWKDDAKPLERLCIVTTPTHPDPRWTTIVVESEAMLVRAFGVVFRHFAPDILADFNGGQYDWPYIVETARQTGQYRTLVETMSAHPLPKNEKPLKRFLERAVYEKGIKVGASSTFWATVLRVPGCVPVDTRAMFMQLFPKADIGRTQSALSYYLEACNLGSKEDMPIAEMFDIYEARDARRMREVANYCVVDAQRCQELLVKRSVISEKLAVASLTLVSFADAVYYADSCKVENLAFAFAERNEFLCATARGEKRETDSKYPGAWVFRPKKGAAPDPTRPATVKLESVRSRYVAAQQACAAALGSDSATVAAAESEKKAAGAAVDAVLETYANDRPIGGLDFSSLYPSIIMAYNLSPERFVSDPAFAQRLRSEGRELHHVNFPYEGKTVEGWFVRHGNDRSEAGLFPRILRSLKTKRKVMKKELAIWTQAAEVLELVAGNADKAGAVSNDAFRAVLVRTLEESEPLNPAAQKLVDVALAAADTVEAYHALVSKVEFRRGAADSKQKALKLIMNTFYGVAGSKTSALFLLALAGGVTSAGRRNIKLVAEFVRAQRFEVLYGDTDSVYPSPPQHYFREADADYGYGRTSREEYWTQMVLIAMDALNTISGQINAMLQADNGTTDLRVVYEEVLFPYVLCGKKKYAGIAHVGVPNFRPAKYFIRGMRFICQGQSALTTTIGDRILWGAFSLDNTRDFMTIVKDTLKEAVTNADQWKFDDFVMSMAWRPDKKNQTAHAFIARMRVKSAEEQLRIERAVALGQPAPQALYTVPGAGERFKYVLIRPQRAYDHRGRTLKPKKSDLMEYADAALAEGMQVNIPDYLSRDPLTLCARFVNYAFITETTFDDEDAAKAADAAAQKASNKALKAFIDAAVAGPQASLKLGAAYRKAWSSALVDGYDDLCKQGHGTAADILHGPCAGWIENPLDADANLEILHEATETAVAAVLSTDGTAFTDHLYPALGFDAHGNDIVADPATPGEKTTHNLYAASRDLRPVGRCRRGVRPRISSMGVIWRELKRIEIKDRAAVVRRVQQLGPVFASYSRTLVGMSAAARAAVHAADPEKYGKFVPEHSDTGQVTPLSVESQAQVAEFRELWYSHIGSLCALRRHQRLVEGLEELQARRVKAVLPKTAAAVRKKASISASKLRPMDLGIFADSC